MAVAYILLVTVFAGLMYYLAVRSRKTYKCPECGESIKVEHMETTRCGTCGSLLKRKE